MSTEGGGAEVKLKREMGDCIGENLNIKNYIEGESKKKTLIR